jgi:hypothetical protein
VTSQRQKRPAAGELVRRKGELLAKDVLRQIVATNFLKDINIWRLF